MVYNGDICALLSRIITNSALAAQHSENSMGPDKADITYVAIHLVGHLIGLGFCVTTPLLCLSCAYHLL